MVALLPARGTIKKQSETGVRMEKSATNIYSYGAVTGESNPIEVTRKAKTASRTTGRMTKAD